MTVDGSVVGSIGPGLLLLVGIEAADTDEDVDAAVEKVVNTRVFPDEAGRMNRNLVDVQGGVLIVSQFTLAADLSGGHRPSFSGAAPPELGRRLVERVVVTARRRHAEVACGEFGADMQVHLVNDGPVTLSLTLRHRIAPAT